MAEVSDDATLLGAWADGDRASGRRLVDEGKRLLREAKGLARLSHENVVQVHDAGTDGEVADFGLVRSMDGGWLSSRTAPTTEELDTAAETLTRTGASVGTPSYMSPEQHLALEIDARTDQFSYCVSLYEALYGQRLARLDN